MISRIALALALLLAPLILGAPAYALSVYGGYQYPSTASNSSTAPVCTPACDGVRVTYIEPTPTYIGKNSESVDFASMWVGIAGNTATGVHSAYCTLGSGNHSSLFQVGTDFQISNTAVQTHKIWWEAFFCNNVVHPTQTITLNAGDQITIELLCTSGCTSGGSSQVWQFTWTRTDLSTGITTSQVITQSAGTWVVDMDYVMIMIEDANSAVADSAASQSAGFTPVKFSNAQIHQGGAWVPLPVTDLSPKTFLYSAGQQIKTSPSWYIYYVASPSIDTSRAETSFYICSFVVQTTTSFTTQPCPEGAYISPNGLGP